MNAPAFEDISQAATLPDWAELVEFAAELIHREKLGRFALGDLLLSYGDIPPRGRPVSTDERFWLKTFAAEVDSKYVTLSEYRRMAAWWTVEAREAVSDASYTRMRMARALAISVGEGPDFAVSLIEDWLADDVTLEAAAVDVAKQAGREVAEQTTLAAVLSRWPGVDLARVPAWASLRDGWLTIRVEVGE